MVVDENGAVTVSHEVSANAAGAEVVDRIHRDVQRLVTGFFNTWRTFVVASPFPETESQLKIENPGKQYRLSYLSQSGDVTSTMNNDFLITEWSLSTPTVKRTVKPRFEKTIDGLLMTDYRGVFEPIGDGIKTTLDFHIDYQDVNGVKVPRKVRLSGMHGNEPVEAELTFTMRP